MNFQRCAGCGIEAESHPIVGVGISDEALKDYALPDYFKIRGDGVRFDAYPVCAACHADPSHRRRTLKMSFFERGHLGTALAAAGSNSIG